MLTILTGSGDDGLFMTQNFFGSTILSTVGAMTTCFIQRTTFNADFKAITGGGDDEVDFVNTTALRNAFVIAGGGNDAMDSEIFTAGLKRIVSVESDDVQASVFDVFNDLSEVWIF